MLTYILPSPLSFGLLISSDYRDYSKHKSKENTIPEGFGNSVLKIWFSYFSFIKVPYAFE